MAELVLRTSDLTSSSCVMDVDSSLPQDRRDFFAHSDFEVAVKTFPCGEVIHCQRVNIDRCTEDR